MDALTEKYSVFDFFNLMIVGMTFLFLMCICFYSKSFSWLIEVSNTIDNSAILFVVTIIGFLGSSLLIGAIFQVISERITHNKSSWEQGMIKQCLNEGALFENSIRLKRVRKKACDYFRVKDKQLNEEYNAAFFAYCVYYLHVNNLDKKAEKLRETEGLSTALSCAFFAIPLTGTLILILQTNPMYNWNMDLRFTMLIFLLCLLLGIAFYERYKMVCKNRIRIVLSTYNACRDKEMEREV